MGGDGVEERDAAELAQALQQLRAIQARLRQGER